MADATSRANVARPMLLYEEREARKPLPLCEPMEEEASLRRLSCSVSLLVAEGRESGPAEKRRSKKR